MLVMLAMLLQCMKLSELLVLVTILGAAALVLDPRIFVRLLKRSRWLMLTLLLVFSFATPGEYLSIWPEVIAPTYEGIQSGVVQLLRLVIILAGLTLLLATTTREMLMGGLYTLLRPCAILGISPARFTARIWLTLDYVERDPVRKGQHWKILETFEERDPVPVLEKVVLFIPDFSCRDILIGTVLFVGVFWWMA